MRSTAATVRAYLDQLPPERRQVLEAVRAVILANKDPEVEESMQYGMIGYCVPHRLFPAGYHCDPEQALPFAGLAAQKNHMSLYLMWVYGGGSEEAWLRQAWAKAGKKLDMGKCCIRFKRLDALPLDVLAEAFRRMPAREWIGRYLAAMDGRAGPAGSKAAKTSARAKAARPSAGKPRAAAQPKTKSKGRDRAR